MSAKDKNAPSLRDRRLGLLKHLPTIRSLIIGVSGQVGSALVEELGSASCFGT